MISTINNQKDCSIKKDFSIIHYSLTSIEKNFPETINYKKYMDKLRSNYRKRLLEYAGSLYSFMGRFLWPTKLPFPIINCS